MTIDSFAYVDFATPDGQIVAITMSEGHLDGRRLLIKAGRMLPVIRLFVLM